MCTTKCYWYNIGLGPFTMISDNIITNFTLETKQFYVKNLKIVNTNDSFRCRSDIQHKRKYRLIFFEVVFYWMTIKEEQLLCYFFITSFHGIFLRISLLVNELSVNVGFGKVYVPELLDQQMNSQIYSRCELTPTAKITLSKVQQNWVEQIFNVR